MKNYNNKEDKVVFLPLGILLGSSIGIMVDEISIGLCFGIMVGMIADYIINSKNKK